MTAIVKGHGARIDDKETFVPTGTEVKMYSDYDVNLATSSALVAIANGEFGTPNDSADAGTDIANYKLYTQDDGFYAKWIAMGQESSVPIWWVGADLANETRLCNEDGTCDETAGTHDCSGVFGQVKDAQIILLACRGYVGPGAVAGTGPTSEYGSDADDPLYNVNTDMDKWLAGFINRAKADPDAAEQEYDALPQGTQALALASGVGACFSYGRWVRTYADADDLDNLFTHLKQNVGQRAYIVWLLTNVTPYGAALDAAAVRHPGNFKDFFISGGSAWRGDFMARPDFANALAAVTAAEPARIAWGDFEALNKDYVKNLGEGAGAAFWQRGETLVIGGEYRSPYGQAILDNGGAEGTLTMLARGGILSSGGVEVSGVADEAAFRRAFARLSNKSIRFT